MALKSLAQAGLWIEDTEAGYSLEWDLQGDAQAACKQLAEIDLDGVVIGLGKPLIDALSATVPGLVAFPAIDDLVSMPSTQCGLWTLVQADRAGDAFDQAERLIAALDGHFSLNHAQPMMRYRDGRDLTGYVDGTENPKDDDAVSAALVPAGEWAGGSFAIVQRYQHFRSKFFKLAEAERDNVIGRRLSDNVEFEDAPISAHVKRNEQESFDPPQFMLRRSMPWGDVRCNGLVFIGFMSNLGVSENMLARMTGAEDGVSDALMKYTQALSGAYYFCPPQIDGRLNLASLILQS